MTDAPTWYTERFWEALADGTFLLGHCPRCEEVHFPPAPVCRACDGDAEMVAADGTGRLHSFTRQHRTGPGFDAPVVLGTVELSEGPRVLMCVDAPYETLTIGQAVTVVAREYDGGYDRGRTAGYPVFVAEPA